MKAYEIIGLAINPVVAFARNMEEANFIAQSMQYEGYITLINEIEVPPCFDGWTLEPMSPPTIENSTN
jgi:hypothetical protein